MRTARFQCLTPAAHSRPTWNLVGVEDGGLAPRARPVPDDGGRGPRCWRARSYSKPVPRTVSPCPENRRPRMLFGTLRPSRRRRGRARRRRMWLFETRRPGEGRARRRPPSLCWAPPNLIRAHPSHFSPPMGVGGLPVLVTADPGSAPALGHSVTQLAIVGSPPLMSHFT